jgi:hypothetical protein
MFFQTCKFALHPSFAMSSYHHPQTQKLVAQNSPVNSDNNMSGSNNVNDSENAGGSGMNINGGSDNGSGNQV